MANEVNIYTPRYLAEVVRQAPPVHTYFRDTFFTNIKTFSTERVDIDIVKGDRRMAAFVHPRVGGTVLKGNGYTTESYKPPLVNPYDVTTADQLLTRLPGEDLYSGMSPAGGAEADGGVRRAERRDHPQGGVDGGTGHCHRLYPRGGRGRERGH